MATQIATHQENGPAEFCQALVLIGERGRDRTFDILIKSLHPALLLPLRHLRNSLDSLHISLHRLRWCRGDIRYSVVTYW